MRVRASGGEGAGGGVSGATARFRELRREEPPLELEAEAEADGGFLGERGRDCVVLLLSPVARRAETEGCRTGEVEGGSTFI